MSDEDSERGEIKTICRSIALEVLIVELLAHHYLRAPDPIAAAAAHREHMRNTWSQIAAPFLHDPAASELIVGEIGDAIDEFIKLAAEGVTRIASEQRRGT
jgi:hypothetical protein